MKVLFLLLYILFLPNLLIAQNNFFTIGPVLGLDQFLSSPSPVTGPNVIASTNINYKTGCLYGIESSYVNGRILADVRLLTTERQYEVKGVYPYNTALTVRVNVKARYYSIPLSVSYLVKNINGIQVFAGAGIVPEWISGQFTRKSYDILGSGRAIVLDSEKPNKAFSLGGNLQVIGRYNLSKRFLLQIQPALHYFPKIQTPFAITNNSSLSLSFSMGYML